jgi:hypothetical protein
MVDVELVSLIDPSAAGIIPTLSCASTPCSTDRPLSDLELLIYNSAIKHKPFALNNAVG